MVWPHEYGLLFAFVYAAERSGERPRAAREVVGTYRSHRAGPTLLGLERHGLLRRVYKGDVWFWEPTDVGLLMVGGMDA
jgi:hypothetical protein